MDKLLFFLELLPIGKERDCALIFFYAIRQALAIPNKSTQKAFFLPLLYQRLTSSQISRVLFYVNHLGNEEKKMGYLYQMVTSFPQDIQEEVVGYRKAVLSLQETNQRTLIALYKEKTGIELFSWSEYT
ncbi:MAG: hypothetical protein FJZ58_02635 [Chlamydiae bacterium]|nr:hypothetical protein [Chlamydiota bacterium]